MVEVRLRQSRTEDADVHRQLNDTPAVEEFIGAISRGTSDTDLRIVETRDSVPVGVVLIRPSDFSRGEFRELVCATLPAYQKSGFGEAACIQLLQAVEETAGPAIVACVDRSNVAGRRLLKRLGAEFMQARNEPYHHMDVYALR